MSKAVILLADGFEECEALCICDVLRRGGVDTYLCGVYGEAVTSSHGVRIICDTVLSDKTLDEDWNLVFLPGGMPGAENLHKSAKVNSLIKRTDERVRIVSAICASPAVVLGPAGLLEGRKATCYPGCESYYPDYNFSKEGVVVSGNVVTAKSAGYAFDLALVLLRILKDKETSERVKDSIYYKEGETL